MSQPPLFHLAIPVHDLKAAEEFYSGVLGCAQGRRSDTWIDYNFFGHQLVTHLSSETSPAATNAVEDEQVPVLHFGALLDFETWEATAAKLKAANAPFIIEPTVRHEGKPGEQHIFFVKDPSGNALEFKSMTNMDEVFAA
ncbi:MAG: VOC family protein [Pseudomonadota bacterium]